MMANNNSLASFTKQYQISKTLRFELKPVAETEEWIKKRNIIGVENNKLIGIDAERAKHCKYAKRLLDELHRLFIEEALNIDSNSENAQKLIAAIIKLSLINELKEANLPGKIIKNILDEKADMWIKQYKEEMPIYWQEDIEELDSKIAEESEKKRINNMERVVNNLKRRCNNPPFKKSGISALFSNEETIKYIAPI